MIKTMKNKLLNFFKISKRKDIDDYFIEDNYTYHKILIGEEYKNNNLLLQKEDTDYLTVNEKIEIRSKIVGTFYYSDNNKILPYLCKNDKVKKNQIIGFIKCLDN